VEKRQLRLLDLVLGGLQARLIRLKALSGKTPNMNHIMGNVWVGGANSLELIINQGFNAVLDLRTEDNQTYKSFLEQHGVNYFNFKIPDRHGVSPEDLIKIVEWLEDEEKKGKKVLVHCNLGRGRAALIVAAYMVYIGGTPEEAIKKIKEKRQVTYLNSRQMQALKEFSKTYSTFHSP
jgi:protein tyrosine/serine phosphatase